MDGSTEKSRSGIAAGVLNATRQTGSVLGVALFGSLVGGDNAFITGAHASLVISAAVLLAGAIAIWHGRAKEEGEVQVKLVWCPEAEDQADRRFVAFLRDEARACGAGVFPLSRAS